MFALLIIPLLVSGCIIVTSPHNLRFYYRLHRYDGQLLYMKAASYGTYAVIFCGMLGFLLKWWFPELRLVSKTVWFLDLSGDAKSNRVSAWLILLSLGSIVCALVFNFLSKLKTFLSASVLSYLISRYSNSSGKNSKIDEKRDNAFYVQAIRLSALGQVLPNGSLGRLFFDSATGRKDVLVTLQSRKVYVGKVKVISEPNEKDGPNQEISITPLLSGYRDKDSLNITFTNDYDKLDHVDTTIVFPLSEVTHASWFNIEIHEEVDNNVTKKADVMMTAP